MDTAPSSKDAAPTGGPATTTLCPSTGVIVAGATPFPDGVELVAASTDAESMVVTDSDLYWANDRSIHRITLGDGVDRTILDRSKLTNTINGLAVDGATVYFTESGSSNQYRVAKMPADGSSAPVTLAGSISPWYLAVAGGYVYYYDDGFGEINRVPTAGGDTTTLVRGIRPDRSFSLVNGFIYFISQVTPTQSSLLRISVNAQAPARVDGGVVAGSDAGADGLVTLVANNRPFSAFCVDGDSIYYCGQDKVTKMPAAGGTSTVLITLPPPNSTVPTIATAGGHLYWATSYPTCPDVNRTAMDGSDQTAIVHAIASPNNFALNATHLYMIAGTGQILRVPR